MSSTNANRAINSDRVESEYLELSRPCVLFYERSEIKNNFPKLSLMRIAGITIPDNKQLVFGLTAIYGVGRSQAARILDA
ncbi:MAG TPA: hypothetical protein VJJ55_01510, partial [Candidatus Paceibacterota bacterium]